MSLSTGLIGVTLAGKLASMMLYLLVGFIIVKAGVIKASDSKTLSSLVVWVFQPAMLFDAFQIDLTAERRATFFVCLGFSFLVYIVWILLSRLLRAPLKLSPIEEASLVYSNTGNLVLPLVSMILGQEYVFYGCAAQLAFHVFIWTHGCSLIRGARSFRPAQILKNTNVIAVLLGLLFTILHIPVPDIIATSISGLGQVVGPLSMMVIGIALAEADLPGIFRMKRAYLISFGRLIVYPLIIIGILYISRFLRIYPEFSMALMVPVMSFAAPPASMVSQLAIIYDRHPIEASSINLMGTLFSLITMPLIIQLYQLLFL